MTTQSPHWTLAATQPAGWRDLLRDFDGGFFQDINALACNPQTGDPIIATLRSGDRTDGVAVGLRYRCRLSARARHAYFPSLPRLRAGIDADAALVKLGEAVSALGVSDITFDSFDAVAAPAAAMWGIAGTLRNEYRVHLARTDEELRHGLSSNHARHVRRGEREGWRLDITPANTAAAMLAHVSDAGTTRAAMRGNAFTAAAWNLDHLARLSDDQWGLAMYCAYSDRTLLSAALIGYGGARAFYLCGGSTEEGYARGAAIWMHWNTMLSLRERGIAIYNLGGVPASAMRTSHPAKGLHRFKAGFGSELVALNGVRWSDASLHTGLHRAAQRFSQTSTGVLVA
jgi:hypothetical protein